MNESAFEKIQGLQWHTGEVMWRALTLPIFEQMDLRWLANWPSLLFASSWATLILEGLLFIFIWPRATRKIWIAGLIGLHLGIAIFLGLHLFGLVMCALVATIFGVASEPQSHHRFADASRRGREGSPANTVGSAAGFGS